MQGMILEARATGAAAVAPQQIGRHTAFIEEDVLAHVAQRLPRRHWLRAAATSGRRCLSACTVFFATIEKSVSGYRGKARK